MKDPTEPLMDPPAQAKGPAKAAQGSPSWIKPGSGSPFKGAAISESSSPWENSPARIEARSPGDGEWRKAFRKARAASASFAALEAQSSSASIEAGKKAVPDQDASSLPSWARAQTPSLPASKARERFELLLPWLAGAAVIALLAGYALMPRSPDPSLSKLGSAIQMSKAAPWMAAAGICALAILALGLACQWVAGLWALRASKKSALAKQSASAKPAKAPRRPKSPP